MIKDLRHAVTQAYCAWQDIACIEEPMNTDFKTATGYEYVNAIPDDKLKPVLLNLICSMSARLDELYKEIKESS